MSEIKLNVRPFEMGTEKEAALKPLEEAAEVFAAWQEIDGCGSPEQCKDCDLPNPCESIFALADEIADVIQESCNLAARYGINLQAAMERCEQRNRERGRYPMEVKNAESCGDCERHDCNCGGDCGAVSAGTGVLREKSPEEMSAEELFEALNATDCNCRKILGDDWCVGFDTCGNCRKFLLDLLKAEHEREVEEFIELIKDGRDEYMRLRTENGIMLNELIRRRDRLDELERQVVDLTHERDRLRRRLEEMNDAGITALHRLLREAAGEAKNIADAARIYVENARKSRKPDPELEAVIKRLRGYDVYMTEPPSKNASRLFACITGNKNAEIACGNDIEAVRDKLIELLSYEKVPDGE